MKALFPGRRISADLTRIFCASFEERAGGGFPDGTQKIYGFSLEGRGLNSGKRRQRDTDPPAVQKSAQRVG